MIFDHGEFTVFDFADDNGIETPLLENAEHCAFAATLTAIAAAASDSLRISSR